MSTVPAWVGPTMAIALVVIALAFAVIALAIGAVARATAREVRELSEELGKLRAELTPALSAVRRIGETGAELSDDLRGEVKAYLEASRELRRQLDRGVRRVRHRLSDLDALYEVVHGEVEETALDVAARLRSVRRGTSVLGRIRRLLIRGRR